MSRIHHAGIQLAGLDFHELWRHAPRVLAEVLPGAHLQIQNDGDAAGTILPLSRGWHDQAGPEPVYLDYYLGPPETLRFAVHGLRSGEARESREVAAFFQLLRGALFSAGYQHELEAQARTDWFTNLPRRHALDRALQGVTPNQAVPVLLLALQLYPSAATLSDSMWLTVRTFVQALKTGLDDGEQIFHLGGNDFAILASATNGLKLKRLISQVAPADYRLGLASSSETQGGTLVQLAQQRQVLTGAELQPDVQVHESAGRLKPENTLLAALPSVPVVVHCEAALNRAALEALTKNWFFHAPVHLLLDIPTGSALQLLRNIPRPVLIVTTSRAYGYLSDLRNFEPEGLLTGQTEPAALREALLRVSRFETLDVGSSSEPAQLFPRERQVWSRVAQGHTNGQIAAELGISGKTIANYVSNLQEKLRLDSRTRLALDYWKLPGVTTVPDARENPDEIINVLG